MQQVNAAARTTPSLSRSELTDSYNIAVPAYSRGSVHKVNLGKRAQADDRRPAGPQQPVRQAPPPNRPAPPPARQAPPAPAAPTPPPRPLQAPQLQHPLQRGQKSSLGLAQGDRSRLSAAFGWNVTDGRCDVDASAFLLRADGRVPGDEWFVFYGQTASPDGSVRLGPGGNSDRQVFSIDLGRLDPRIERIVFVMTINEAIEKRLDFGMIREAWLRVLDGSGREILSYRPQDFSRNITSMTLGEMYLHRGEWRFNPVGNGLNIDLAGQCAVYGVNIRD